MEKKSSHNRMLILKRFKYEHQKHAWLMTEDFKVREGVHQGSVSSPNLFNIVMDEIINYILGEVQEIMLSANFFY